MQRAGRARMLYRGVGVPVGVCGVAWSVVCGVARRELSAAHEDVCRDAEVCGDGSWCSVWRLGGVEWGGGGVGCIGVSWLVVWPFWGAR